MISQFDYTYRPDRSIDTWTIDQGSGATTWTFGYDGAHQLTAATRRDGSGALLEADTYGYDKAGNRIQVGNGTTAPTNASVNNLNQLVSQRDFGTTTFSGVVDEPATVTVNGKPAKVMSTDGGAPFKFEALVDLDAGANTVVVQAKDGRNNTSTKNYSVTTTGTSETFEYDANGNLRYQKQPNGTVIREYQWDQQNRLLKAIIGTHESDYSYDGESRRVRIRENERGTQTKDETFVWCGARICQKRSGSTVERNYFDQGFEEGTTDYSYTRDHLGSVREVVASDGVTVASRLSYDAWGKIAESGSGALTDFAFTGHAFDRPSGLHLAWARAYDSGIGRWLSNDPLGISGGINLYAYVNSNPSNSFDRDGMSPGDNCCESSGHPGCVVCWGRPPPPDPCPKPGPPDPAPTRFCDHVAGADDGQCYGKWIWCSYDCGGAVPEKRRQNVSLCAIMDKVDADRECNKTVWSPG